MKSRSTKEKKVAAVSNLPVVVPRTPLVSSGEPTVLPKNWKNALVVCGSNSCNQLHVQDMMLSSFTVNEIIEKGDIEYVTCGSTVTAILTSDGVPYIWGTGIPGCSFKIPTPLSSMRDVRQISCGQSHAACITSEGAVYTWGSGECGALGHGTKTAINTPKQVNGLAQLTTLQVSCGAFHTAFIANESSKITYLRIPDTVVLKPNSVAAKLSAFPVSAEAEAVEISTTVLTQGKHKTSFGVSREYFRTGRLYCCGVSKAGQLGLPGDNNFSKKNVMRPTLVPFFEEKGLAVVQVSCGFHHTLALTCPPTAIKFSTACYSFGYNEYGRLGVGDEETRLLPQLVDFGGVFHPTCVSAGEQHSLASNSDAAYAWGSNSMGQLGVSSPTVTEMAVTPQRIPLPEGMQLRCVVAGGRHSGAITECNRVLTWGWAEEGQTGHGSERNSYLSKPCRMPRVLSEDDIDSSGCGFVAASNAGSDSATPVHLALGMAHTVVLVRNRRYEEELPKPPPPAAVVVPEPVEEPEPEPMVSPQPPTPEPVVEAPVLVIAESEAAQSKRRAVLCDEEEEEEEPEPEPRASETLPAPAPLSPVVSLKDLLKQREERATLRGDSPVLVSEVKEAKEVEPEAEPEPKPQQEPEPEPVTEPEPEPQQEPEPEPVTEPEPEPEPVKEQEKQEEQEAPVTARGRSDSLTDKEARALTQALDGPGNYLRREELRKSRKQQQQQQQQQSVRSIPMSSDSISGSGASSSSGAPPKAFGSGVKKA